MVGIQIVRSHGQCTASAASGLGVQGRDCLRTCYSEAATGGSRHPHGRKHGGGDPPARGAFPALPALHNVGTFVLGAWADVAGKIKSTQPTLGMSPGRSPRPGGRVKRASMEAHVYVLCPLDDGRGWRLRFWGQKGSCVNG
jgi:hypothetical protein